MQHVISLETVGERTPCIGRGFVALRRLYGTAGGQQQCGDQRGPEEYLA